MSLFAQQIRVEPTLAGLRVVPSAKGRPIPRITYCWDQVSQQNAVANAFYWSVLDEKGRRAQLNQRPLLLEIRGARQNRTARRAQSRYLRNRLHADQLRVAQQFGPRWPGLILLLIGAACSIGCVIPLLWSIERIAHYPSLGLPWVYLSVLIAILALAGVLVGAGVFVTVRQGWLQLSANVAGASFDAAGLVADLCDGQELRASWMDVRSVHRHLDTHDLVLRDGSILRLVRLDGRMRTILDLVKPISDHRTAQPANKWMAWRLAGLVLGCNAVAVAIGWQNQKLWGEPWWTLPGTFLLAQAGMGLALVLNVIVVRRNQRRRRRAVAA